MKKPSMTDNVPQLGSQLPELVTFINVLVQDYALGKFDSWQRFAEAVKAFFLPAKMKQIETVIPGWLRMAGFAEGATLVHVAAALTALHLAPEYRQASLEQKAICQWIILLHDIGKEIHSGERDNIHAFRSAVLAAKALPRLGFSVTSDYTDQIQAWSDLTDSAVIQDSDKGVLIQDNQKLPEILAGIDRLFGRNTAPTYIVKAILFHLSINTIQKWPQAAPVSALEIKRSIEADLLPYVRLIMLIDSDAWELFNEEIRRKQRREVLFAFQTIEKGVLL
jgi:hypothetical protein